MSPGSAIRLALALFVTLMLAPPGRAETIDLSTIQPNQCAGPFKYDQTSKACKGDEDKMAKITLQVQCQGEGIGWANGKCEFLEGKEPKPDCGSLFTGLAVKDGKCVIERKTPSSAPGDYVGDCFRIVATPSPNDLGFEVGERLSVLSQSIVGDDRELQVAKAKRAGMGPVPIPYFCSTVGPVYKKLMASQLNAAGAERLGWTYGVLTMPYKYYRREKSFGSSASIGPYLGRRSGAAGSAITFAVAATIGPVKGEVLNASGTVTSTPDLMAYSIAAGWMFDISKAPGVKPFKIGLFVGQDRVSSSDSVKFKQNGRGWIAFQIGYDFTDN